MGRATETYVRSSEPLAEVIKSEVREEKQFPEKWCAAAASNTAASLPGARRRCSPSSMMTNVEVMRPKTPPVTPERTMEMAELTTVLPSSRVHSSKLPLWRTGMIFRAYSFSFGSPAFSRMRRPTKSRLSKPSVRPLNMAEKQTRPVGEGSVSISGHGAMINESFGTAERPGGLGIGRWRALMQESALQTTYPLPRRWPRRRAGHCCLWSTRRCGSRTQGMPRRSPRPTGCQRARRRDSDRTLPCGAARAGQAEPGFV